jgi:hypothetical protein
VLLLVDSKLCIAARGSGRGGNHIVLHECVLFRQRRVSPDVVPSQPSSFSRTTIIGSSFPSLFGGQMRTKLHQRISCRPVQSVFNGWQLFILKLHRVIYHAPIAQKGRENKDEPQMTDNLCANIERSNGLSGESAASIILNSMGRFMIWSGRETTLQQELAEATLDVTAL